MIKNIYQDKFTFWEIISKAIKIFKENINQILIITLLVYIPINIALFYLGESLMNSPDITFEQFSNYMEAAGWLENLVWVMATIFVIFIAKQSIDGEQKTFKENLQSTFSKWWVAICANLLYGFWVGLLLLLLIVPGIIFAVYWIFFIYILVLKDISISKTFEYSKKLVKWRWWEIFGYGLFSFATTFILWIALWFTPYVNTLLWDISTSVIVDLYSLFIVIIFTLKFLNIDKPEEQSDIEQENQVEQNKEYMLSKEKDIEL